MIGEKERVDAYLDTINRIEPDIAMLDQGAALASIAISLRRIADTLEAIDKPNEHGDSFAQRLYYSIYNPLQDVLAQWQQSR